MSWADESVPPPYDVWVYSRIVSAAVHQTEKAKGGGHRGAGAIGSATGGAAVTYGFEHDRGTTRIHEDRMSGSLEAQVHQWTEAPRGGDAICRKMGHQNFLFFFLYFLRTHFV